MAEVLLDTLGLARQLRERAGFSPEQAEETAQAIADAFSGPVATRGDLAEQRADVRSDLARQYGQMSTLCTELRAEMTELRSAMDRRFEEQGLAFKADLSEQRSDMTKLVLTVATGQVALLLAAMFSLVRLGH
jgi:hypothetical protein